MPGGDLNLVVFLSQMENGIFKITETLLGYLNLSQEEWSAIRSLADDRSIVIKTAGI